MGFRYTAKIYVDEVEIDHKEGNDVDELYHWMLVKAQGKFGNLSGDVIDTKTNKAVKSFRKSPPD